MYTPHVHNNNRYNKTFLAKSPGGHAKYQKHFGRQVRDICKTCQTRNIEKLLKIRAKNKQSIVNVVRMRESRHSCAVMCPWPQGLALGSA